MKTLKQVVTPNSSVMTLTIKIDWAHLWMAGRGEATIDWGDGTSQTMTLTREGDDYVREYYAISKYTIIITGEVTELECLHMNLIALDISRNSSLKELHCDYNNLIRLDVSQNAALVNLSCCENRLTVLKVSQNNALNSINCGYCRLSVDALNDLFRCLPDNGGKITIDGNGGYFECDVSILTAKGWEVEPW